MMNKRLLYFAFFIGFAFHLVLLIALHHYEFRISGKSHAHRVHFLSTRASEILEKKERSAFLGEVFHNLREAPLEIKEELHELVPEFAPTPLISFPKREPILPAEEPFAIELEPILVSVSHPNNFSFYEDGSLSAIEPEFSTFEIPLLKDFGKDEEYYVGNGLVAQSEHFDIQVEYTPRQNRPGYIFKISFYPKLDVLFKRISQNYYFLIDRSNSIPRGRFILNKRIIAEALDYLKPRDTFNILLFDDKVCKFSEMNVPWNEDNVARAREFLKAQHHGGYFAATELYSSLGKVIPSQVSDQEINTAILLSDGDSYLTLEKQRQMIGGWTEQNRGKVSLFSIASGSGNNLSLLDLLSAFNKGALLYSSNHFALADHVQNLIKSIRNPIGKKMTATVMSLDKQMNILLQPKKNRLPYLYKDRPFVLYGCTNRLSDFVLFLQGNFYDTHFDIKKKISLSEAKLGNPGIERDWTRLLTQELYERYFQDGNSKHLEEAKKLLAPLNLPTPLLN